jgi:hypothetical protein
VNSLKQKQGVVCRELFGICRRFEALSCQCAIRYFDPCISMCNLIIIFASPTSPLNVGETPRRRSVCVCGSWRAIIESREEEKKEHDAKYRDRARERRTDLNPDYAPDAAQQITEVRYQCVGGWVGRGG